MAGLIENKANLSQFGLSWDLAESLALKKVSLYQGPSNNEAIGKTDGRKSFQKALNIVILISTQPLVLHFVISVLYL